MGGVLMPATNWYTWPTQADFDTWHNNVVEALNLPRVGDNAASGKPDPTAQPTTAYTQVCEVGDDDWRAPVADHIVTQFPNGLGNPSEPPPPPENVP